MPNMIPSAKRTLRCVSALTLLLPSALVAQRQGGVLVGRVLAGDVAVPGATIIAGRGRVIVARVDGRFRLAMPVGRYEVRARKIGYSTARDSVTIIAGQEATLNFKLERSPIMLEAVSSVGSRGQVRSAIDVPVPVDIIQATDLRATGITATSQMLQATEPGVNVPRASVAEGSDLIHPFTFRGLGPDQVLVLVNGKRRHTSALMNVNGTVGRGSVGVDLDAIPASMIDHIEVLRDGATAQYGSDAVAGVVNIVLKGGVHGDATSTVGRSATTFNRDGVFPGGEQSSSDGRALQASIDKGVVFGERGFLHGAFELRDQGFTNRALADPSLPADANYRFGDPQRHDVALFLNGGNLFSSGLEVYGNVGGSRRTMGAPAAFRFAIASVSPTVIVPVLPILRPTIDDYAGTAGVRGALDDWAWDLSTTYGRNNVQYDVDHTLFPGAPSSTGVRFDAGNVRYAQSTTNLELTRSLNYFDETRLALGTELRTESYRLGAGTAPISGGTGSALQGFPTIGVNQATDQSRHDVAGYVDVESDLSNDVLLGLAGRVEHYSDIGTVGAGKLALRWEPVRKYALRASAERGFRAPSLAQSYYSNSEIDPPSNSFVPNVITVRAANGAAALRPERTMTYSAGIAAEPTSTVSITADLYRIEVKDRIALLDESSYFLSSYSVNGVDTRTNGLDVTANYALRLATAGSLRFSGGLDLNSTMLTRNSVVALVPTPGLSQGVSVVPTLDALSVTRMERGQPRNTLLASAAYQLGDFGALLRTQRFGEVVVSHTQSSAQDQTFGAQWVTDANASYTLLRKYTFTAGANNLFDVYPATDPFNLPFVNGFGTHSPYNAVSPLGFNGRFIFVRLSLYL
jgi:iron complex outermembrane receptor protein